MSDFCDISRDAENTSKEWIPLNHFSCRSSHCRCSVRKDVRKNFVKFTEKHFCQSFFFKKKRLWYRCFTKNLQNFQEHLFYRISLDDCFYSWNCLWKLVILFFIYALYLALLCTAVTLVTVFTRSCVFKSKHTTHIHGRFHVVSSQNTRGLFVGFFAEQFRCLMKQKQFLTKMFTK